MVDDEDVSCADLTDWSAEFEYLGNRIAPLFVHPKSRAHARQYLSGLLAPIERKNGWTIAQHVGEKEPKAFAAVPQSGQLGCGQAAGPES